MIKIGVRKLPQNKNVYTAFLDHYRLRHNRFFIKLLKTMHGYNFINVVKCQQINLLAAANLLIYSIYIDLDPDSTRIQVDALGHTPTPF